MGDFLYPIVAIVFGLLPVALVAAALFW